MNNCYLKYRPLACCKSLSTWAGLGGVRHPGTFWLNWKKCEKIQVEARVFEWTSARNSASPSERTKNSWCQWMKKPFKFKIVRESMWRKQGGQRKWLLPDHYMPEQCGHLVQMDFQVEGISVLLVSYKPSEVFLSFEDPSDHLLHDF